MPKKVARDHLVFALHGPDKGSDEVDAGVFATKLAQIVSALKAADKAVNGKARHQYVIRKLQSSTPTVFIREQTISRQADFSSDYRSGIDAFRDCARAVSSGDKVQAREYGVTARKIEILSSGANDNRFSYGEVFAGTADLIRIDDFLRARAAMIAAPTSEAPSIASDSSSLEWFSGAVPGTFDGVLMAVDLRGSAPECTLVVGEGASITCIFDAAHLKALSRALDRRVKLSGLAIYDKASPLPIRFEISGVEVVKTKVNMSKWVNAFQPFEPLGWEDDLP